MKFIANFLKASTEWKKGGGFTYDTVFYAPLLQYLQIFCDLLTIFADFSWSFEICNFFSVLLNKFAIFVILWQYLCFSEIRVCIAFFPQIFNEICIFLYRNLLTKLDNFFHKYLFKLVFFLQTSDDIKDFSENYMK